MNLKDKRIENGELLDRSKVQEYLECSESKVRYLQLIGELTPVSTIFPRYYFEKSEVEALKSKKLTS